MKIEIKLKKTSSVDLKKVLSNIAGITDIEIFDHYATCNIPKEEITPDGRIDNIFVILGGTNDVKSITLAKR